MSKTKRSIEIVEAEMAAYVGIKTKKEYRALKNELKSLREEMSKGEVDKDNLGLGDIVESITKATGIKSVVDKVSDVLGFDCGCDERKESWNKISLESIRNVFKRKSVNAINDEDYAVLCDLFKEGLPISVVTKDLQLQLHGIYKRVFSITKAGTSCAPCIKSTVLDLYNLYKLNSKQ